MTHAFNDPAAARFAVDNTYSRELEGFYVPWKAIREFSKRMLWVFGGHTRRTRAGTRDVWARGIE
jgi:hypothetical protein